MKAIKEKRLFSLTAFRGRLNAMCSANDHARGGKKEHYLGISCIGVHPGQYYDEETGLHYNYHRYYDPSTGRYISADPIGQEGGINLFVYAENNPIFYIDPTGENAAVIAACELLIKYGPLVIGAAISLCNNPPKLCKEEPKCDPCPQPPPPRIDRVPPGRPHKPCPGDHWHYFEYHQAPDCTCRLVERFGGCLEQGGFPPGIAQ